MDPTRTHVLAHAVWRDHEQRHAMSARSQLWCRNSCIHGRYSCTARQRHRQKHIVAPEQEGACKLLCLCSVGVVHSNKATISIASNHMDLDLTTAPVLYLSLHAPVRVPAGVRVRVRVRVRVPAPVLVSTPVLMTAVHTLTKLSLAPLEFQKRPPSHWRTTGDSLTSYASAHNKGSSTALTRYAIRSITVPHLLTRSHYLSFSSAMKTRWGLLRTY
eukprot:3412911-Pleurochrysis_carterae.AAC.1